MNDSDVLNRGDDPGTTGYDIESYCSGQLGSPNAPADLVDEGVESNIGDSECGANSVRLPVTSIGTNLEILSKTSLEIGVDKSEKRTVQSLEVPPTEMRFSKISKVAPIYYRKTFEGPLPAPGSRNVSFQVCIVNRLQRDEASLFF